MKNKLLIFLTALCMFFSAVPAFATEQRVFDYAELLSEEEEQEVQQWAAEMQQTWGMDLAFLTTNDTEGKTVQQYGSDFYVEQDLGLGENYDGVIFVLDMGGREGQIITCGKAIDIYTDYYIDVMWDDMVDELSAGEYFQAFFTLYVDLHHYATEYEKYQADPDAFLSDYQKYQKRNSIMMSVGIAAIFSIVVAGVSVASMKKSHKNVKPFTDGRAYLKENGYKLSINRDSFATTRTSMMPIPRDDNNHGGGFGGGSWGGGSSTFSGGGGRSFGGGGGRF